ncbi:MAG: MmgE/PrpD family protein, partial [Pseudomonadota bacterium]
MNATQRCTEHVLTTPFASIPDAAVRAAKTFILDSIGVGVAGARAPFAEEIRRAAKGWGAAAVSQGAHVWGAGLRLTASSAAFVNGFQIHCQEFDCVHEPAVVHPMATILAALMAEAERSKTVSGAELIAATTLAVDIAAGIGVASKAPIKFFRPANK